MKKRIVIAGVGCCGKTSVIEEFKRRGYKTLDETAREVISKYAEESLEKKQIRIFRQQIEKEKKHKKGLVFLDRGLMENLAYSDYLMGCLPKEVQNYPEKHLQNRYEYVFALDPLPWNNDGLRVEKKEDIHKVHEKIISYYVNLGYQVNRIKVMPIEDRVDEILRIIEELA